ncbi:MAG: pirin family protein [Acidimicrobiia bacterium]
MANDSAARDAEPCEVEITESRRTELGIVTIRRALPRPGRRTVGAWCFVDHMGPAAVTEDRGLDIGPHPHIGLQTVTWLLSGEILHRDSLGSEQVIRPGQLNLMTAGHGVSHAEEATGTYRGALHGVQLWVAQPAATRDGEAAFEHHPELPQLELDRCTATVLVGEFADVTSPARRDTEHVGVDLDLRQGDTVVPLATDFEYALVVFDGAVSLGGNVLEPGHLGYLGTSRDEVRLRATRATRALLVGGVPFPEPVLMWWNYVARDQAEITAAHADWTAGAERFGSVASPLPRITVGPPPWSVARGWDVPR